MFCLHKIVMNLRYGLRPFFDIFTVKVEYKHTPYMYFLPRHIVHRWILICDQTSYFWLCYRTQSLVVHDELEENLDNLSRNRP